MILFRSLNSVVFTKLWGEISRNPAIGSASKYDQKNQREKYSKYTVQIVKEHYLMIWKVSKCVCNYAFLKTFWPNFEVRFHGIQRSDRLKSMIKRTSVTHTPRYTVQIVKENYLMIWKVSKCALKWNNAFLKTFLPNFEVRFLRI